MSLPKNCTIDVHDLAAIILDCHWKTESRFSHCHLVEVNRGDSPLQTLPSHALPPQWNSVPSDQRRVAYILRHSDSDSSAPVSVDSFPDADGVKLPPPASQLTRKELEDIYWRCKDFNHGYHLSYVAQRVFDSLPKSTTLLARTSAGHVVSCPPSEVTVAEIDIQSHEMCAMVDFAPHPSLPGKITMSQHISGFVGEPFPWIYLLIGKAETVDLAKDPRVALDLSLPQIGGRGGGGELFALERAFDYHSKVLARYADEFEGYKLSGKVRFSDPKMRADGERVVKLVLARLKKVMEGQDDFCRYCGKDGVEQQCSKCKNARFCRECQALGWKYHKVWCR